MLTSLFWLAAITISAVTIALAAGRRATDRAFLLLAAPVATAALGVLLWYQWFGWWRLVPAALLVAAATALWRFQHVDGAAA